MFEETRTVLLQDSLGFRKKRK